MVDVKPIFIVDPTALASVIGGGVINKAVAGLVGVVGTGDNIPIDYNPNWFPVVLSWC